MESNQVKEVIEVLRKDLKRIEPDMSMEMPVTSDPESIQKVKRMSAQASANSMRLAMIARSLSQYKKQREADITLQHIVNGDLKTPKEEHLRALMKSELSEVYAYEELCTRMLELCRQRVTLGQTFLRNAGSEEFNGKLDFS